VKLPAVQKKVHPLLTTGVVVLNILHCAEKTTHPMPAPSTLSRRERQIMDIVYRRGSATAAEVMHDLPDAPSYSAVRAALRLLEERGHVRHRQDGARYVYLPTVPRAQAQRSALQHLVRTFFAGNAADVVNALVEEETLAPSELDRLARLIEDARRGGQP
jgi:BlaI family transcriptional regulator, penicillinase repressor